MTFIPCQMRKTVDKNQLIHENFTQLEIINQNIRAGTNLMGATKSRLKFRESALDLAR